MQFLWMSLFVALITAVDQWTKWLTVTNIPLYQDIPFLDGLFHFTYTQNFGAAFSSLQGMRWLFVAIFLMLTVAVLYDYRKKAMPFSTFERWCIAAIYGGGLGNVIDRVRLGYVVDMIEVEFMNFAVFNVADCFITCGCILMMVSLLFVNKAFWKEEKK
ncbi:MAG: signal peptidase II [Oscillospiraceae bacterium]|nr:signal peptidase II [Oscillospiraceae bacterium]